MLEPIELRWHDASSNLQWLRESVPALFTGTMRSDADSIASLAANLTRLHRDRQLVLADRHDELVLARLDVPGTIFEALQDLEDREISRAEIFHSVGPI